MDIMEIGLQLGSRTDSGLLNQGNKDCQHKGVAEDGSCQRPRLEIVSVSSDGTINVSKHSRPKKIKVVCEY